MDNIRNLKPCYRSGSEDLLSEFFSPCLEACSRYDRAAGYFRSSSLVAWAKALPRFAVGDDLHVRLLVSPELSAADKQALERAVDPEERDRLRQEAADRFLLGALGAETDKMSAEDCLKLLAWLVANEHLEIRFAYPQHVADAGLYHEKLGVYYFPSGERVAFSGSANESASGHTRNWETIDVFRDW